MDEQKINVCRALASIFASKDEISDEEAAFVGRTALDLGLDEGELKLVQQSLATALDINEILKSITEPTLRRFLLRRAVAATTRRRRNLRSEVSTMLLRSSPMSSAVARDCWTSFSSPSSRPRSRAVRPTKAASLSVTSSLDAKMLASARQTLIFCSFMASQSLRQVVRERVTSPGSGVNDGGVSLASIHKSPASKLAGLDHEAGLRRLEKSHLKPLFFRSPRRRAL